MCENEVEKSKNQEAQSRRSKVRVSQGVAYEALKRQVAVVCQHTREMDPEEKSYHGS